VRTAPRAGIARRPEFENDSIMARPIYKALVPAGLLVLLSAALLGNYLAACRVDWLQLVAREIQAACRDPGTQWMVVACLVSYCLTFLVLERRLPQRGTEGAEGKSSAFHHEPGSAVVSTASCDPAETRRRDASAPSQRHPAPGREEQAGAGNSPYGGGHSAGAEKRAVDSTPHPSPLPGRGGEGGGPTLSVLFRGQWANSNFWLVAFLVLVLVRYAVDYADAAKSVQVVVLLTGIVMGKGMALWAGGAKRPLTRPADTLSPSDGERAGVRGTLSLLLFLLAASALWQPEMGMEFHYHGLRRWEGIWDNPNLYGLLMGVGMVLALGLLGACCPPQASGGKKGFVSRIVIALCLIAVGLCGFGLLKSYSRGAWLGTTLALAGLLWQWITLQVSSGAQGPVTTFIRRNWLRIAILLLSSLVICFWQFRHTESPLVRRMFSVGNVNDFSWRNRVAAWQGAGRMLLARPLAGFGWGQAEEAYRKDYHAERLEETAAIQLNDYLTLGISAGVPALLCFLAYLAIAGRQAIGCARRGGRLSTSDREPSASLAAAAGVMVLLVGFWFDGGLFKLPTAVVFWMLLELARIFPHPARRPPAPHPMESGQGEGRPRLPLSRSQITLRWLAGLAAVLALGLTVLHVGLPQFSVGPRTLSVARHWLVPAREKADFDYLAAQGSWEGKPLKHLMQQAHLASYNRGLVNWKLEDDRYRQFVLSPEIDPAWDGDLNWRRALWEYFYPRIRKETNLPAAAETVERQLRERVKIVPAPNAPKTIAEMWRQQRADERGVEVLSVAALRSVGIPARLSESGLTEYWNGVNWQIAPHSAK